MAKVRDIRYALHIQSAVYTLSPMLSAHWSLCPALQSFWLTDSSDTMHVSVSTLDSCQPSQSLSEYGLVTVGDAYHIAIRFNTTALVVEVSDGIRADWTQTWPRQADPDVLGGTLLRPMDCPRSNGCHVLMLLTDRGSDGVVYVEQIWFEQL